MTWSAVKYRVANAPWTLIISLAVMSGFVILGVHMPEQLASGAASVLEFTTSHFGWLYLFATTGFLIFCIGVGFSAYGSIRLGADGEAPEFPYPTWLGMIFSAGMGVGLVFWGVAEPMSHFVESPLGMAEPRSAEAAGLAMQYSFFHWGFHQWANFGVVGLAIAYARFRLGRPGMISETFRASLGERVDGPVGYGINTLAVLSTVFGVATTLGLGVIQINSGLDTVAGIDFGLDNQLAILAGIAVIFLLASLTPLEAGIRWVSDANMLLAAVVLVFVFFAGPTDFITAVLTNALGDYFANLIGMSLVMEPYTGDDWVERWTIFYWAWGLSWAPFVGSFIARISRGRTVREFVLGVIGVPVLLSMVWFATFGGSALHFELFEDAGLGDAVTTEVSSALFRMLELLPAAGVLGPAVLLLIVLFVITSANSATFVLGMFTSRGRLNPGRSVRLIWGVATVLVTGTLLISGGLGALQTISIIAAFPFMVLMIFMATSLLRAFRDEQRQKELHEALLRERIQRLLEEHDVERENIDPEAGDVRDEDGQGR
ncbi:MULTISPECIES: BCCT family transporter [unclassified Wenzhouxiangella]|uniref:BCCT family transporter n=1 Tax=unclassified Wenzhouxiangella TaxID=2613841 RepID=UPI000E329320|nr:MULTISPECIES: BCCT family transporter [unclassified Wenzhouxiangella]RFF27440.1 BCCT family transporter [Wenzhouxiangella sp. 15181]RFP68868.1 BCCT family transporter [Wenzhouxiangella sp. 15190]